MTEIPKKEELYREDIGSGRPNSRTSAVLEIVDSTLSQRHPNYGTARDYIGHLREGGVPIGKQIISEGIEGLKDYGWRSIRNAVDRTLIGTTDFLFGEEFGRRVRNGVYDHATEFLVDKAARDYLRGYSPLKFIPAKFGSKQLVDVEKDGKVRKLLGKFKGRKAYIAEDIENALGKHYEPIRQEVGMAKEQFNFIAQKYIEFHENWEYVVKKRLKREMSEDEHAKGEAYSMRSLNKYRGTMAGADEIFRVGMAINRARNDELGLGVKKYLTGEVLAAGLN